MEELAAMILSSSQLRKGRLRLLSQRFTSQFGVRPFQKQEDFTRPTRSSDKKNLFGGAIVRVRADGRDIVSYKFDPSTELAGASVSDFAPTSRGELYEIARLANGTQYLVRFGSDGEFRGKASLRAGVREEKWEAMQIGVFGNGDLLIAGNSEEDGSPQPFVGLFDSSGQLLRRITLPGDVGSNVTAEVPRTSALSHLTRPQREEAISFTTVEFADDGNLYLVRMAQSGPVYIVNPAGQVQQRLKLSAPHDSSLSSVKVGGRRVAAEFVRKVKNANSISEVVIQVLDSTTGEKYAEYRHSSAELGTALACYVPETFSFVAMGKGGGLVILKARPD